MKFALVANPAHPRTPALVERLRGLLGSVEVEERTAETVGATGVPLASLMAEVVVCVGGDGTLLHVLSQVQLPLFGVNTGEVGFLTEVEADDDLVAAMQRLKARDYHVERLQRLEVLLNGESIGIALNEAVVHSARVAKMQRFVINLAGREIDSLRADGLIVATPTGSTCYAMSAGAPILAPSVEAHIIVPIAPYRIGARPLVLPAREPVTVRLLKEKGAMLVLDGRDEIALSHDDTLEFRVAAEPAHFVRFSDNFFERVHRKLRMQ